MKNEGPPEVIAEMKAIIADLLTRGLEERSRANDTALLLAAKGNLQEIALELLERGALVNAAGENLANMYFTPIYWAVDHGNEVLVDAFLAKGAVVDPQKPGEKNVLLCAMRRLNEEGPERMRIALKLVLAGAKTEVGGGVEGTPMIWAAFHGKTDIVKALLRRKADPCVPDAAGVTAELWAWRNGHHETARVLTAAVGEETGAVTPELWAWRSGRHRKAHALSEAMYEIERAREDDAREAAREAGQNSAVALSPGDLAVLMGRSSKKMAKSWIEAFRPHKKAERCDEEEPPQP